MQYKIHTKYEVILTYLALVYIGFICWALVGFAEGHIQLTKYSITSIIGMILLMFIVINVLHVFLLGRGLRPWLFFVL